jgi:hypothetical protein
MQQSTGAMTSTQRFKAMVIEVDEKMPEMSLWVRFLGGTLRL